MGGGGRRWAEVGMKGQRSAQACHSVHDMAAHPPSDMGPNALGNYLRVPFTFVCNEREVVDDWPRIDGQFCQTSHAMPTKTVRVDMVKMFWLRRGVKVRRG